MTTTSKKLTAAALAGMITISMASGAALANSDKKAAAAPAAPAAKSVAKTHHTAAKTSAKHKKDAGGCKDASKCKMMDTPKEDAGRNSSSVNIHNFTSNHKPSNAY